MRTIQSLRRRQGGFTLIELAIVIALAALIMFIVFARLTKTQNSRISSDEASQLTQIMTDARTKFASQGDFTGVTSKVLIDNGLIPSRMVSGSTVVTGWGTTVVAAPINLNGTANDALQLTYPVPKANCPDFVTSAAGSVAKVTVGTTVVKNVPTGANTIDMTALGTACDASGTGNVNVLLAQGR